MRYNMRKQQRAPCNGRASLGSWQGGVSFGSQLGFESPAFHYSLMNNKLNSKKNELWKMKLSK